MLSKERGRMAMRMETEAKKPQHQIKSAVMESGQAVWTEDLGGRDLNYSGMACHNQSCLLGIPVFKKGGF